MFRRISDLFSRHHRHVHVDVQSPAPGATGQRLPLPPPSSPRQRLGPMLRSLPLKDGAADPQRIDELPRCIGELRELSDEPEFQARLDDLVGVLQRGAYVDVAGWAARLGQALRPVDGSDFRAAVSPPELTAAQATARLRATLDAYSRGTRGQAQADMPARQALAASLYQSIDAFLRARHTDLSNALAARKFFDIKAYLVREAAGYLARHDGRGTGLRFAIDAGAAAPAAPEFDFGQLLLLPRLADALLSWSDRN